jgi:hypothetical protein
LDHYRCYEIYVAKTGQTRISKTVEFFPYRITMPKTSSADAATQAATDLVHALQNPAPAAPFAQLGNKQLAALRQLSEIFATILPQDKSRPTPPRVPTRITPLQPAVPPPSETIPPTRPNVIRPQTVAPPRVLRSNQPPPLTNDASARYERFARRHQANHVTTITNQCLTPTSDILMESAFPHHCAAAVLDPNTGQTLNYRHLIQDPKTAAIWTRSMANELGRLTQGVADRNTGTNTLTWIPHSAVPKGRTVTYARVCCDIRPQKEEVNRTRVTVGGNLIDYPGKVSTDTAGLTTAKLVMNSTISTSGA